MGIDWNSQPLGQIKDTHLAKRLGVSDVAVGKQRRKRGILVCGSSRMLGNCRVQGQHAGINWDEQPLGKVSDKALARKLGVDPSSVRSARSVRKKRRAHGHKCPVCFDVFECHDGCKVDEDDVSNDLELGRYRTCESCLSDMEKQKDNGDGNPVFQMGPPSLKVGW